MTAAHHPSNTGSTSTVSHTPGAPYFTPAEVETFWADDRSATAAIVGLMVGIFTLGLIGYLCVCYWVS
jgi:hypothetical protein